MKKAIAIVICTAIMLSVFTGCAPRQRSELLALAEQYTSQLLMTGHGLCMQCGYNPLYG